MKKLFILSIITFFFYSCEEVVDVDVPSTEPKLVIDASFNVLFNETPVTASSVVKLRLTANYFDEQLPTVTDATVFVTNLATNDVINFSDGNLDGNYEPDTSFIPEENITYELTIIYNNETFKGTATRIASTPFVSVEQGDETLFSGEETELKIAFNDDSNAENYYIFDFTNNIFTAIEDRFFNGTAYNFSFFYQEDEIELPTTVTIKMSGVSKDYYTYFRVLLNQSGQGGGGPFETVPASLLGNVVNTTNQDNFPLGYFHISETDTFTISLIEN